MAGIHTFAAFIKDSQELLTTAEAQCPGYDILLLLVRIHVCVLEGNICAHLYLCVCMHVWDHVCACMNLCVHICVCLYV